MTAIRRCSLFLLLSLLSLTAQAAEAPPFEIRDGDRVVFLGDTLLERENTYGYLEARMHEQFPTRHFTVRNISWAGDTPRLVARQLRSSGKGWERLKEAIALTRPTVVFLGYGMAASLQEMTDRSGDISLNPDTTRYGAEPMSSARFKKELGELMDSMGKDVRFVLLGPVRHEDLREIKPGLPDPAAHNALLDQYARGIEELATERAARFVSLNFPVIYDLSPEQIAAMPTMNKTILSTENGIHLNATGAYGMTDKICVALGWGDRRGGDVSQWYSIPPGPRFTKEQIAESMASYEREESLRKAVIQKNDLFFHRFRPENGTYLFGFRKHEQGQNAKEIPEFDPLVDAADAEIDRLKAALRAPAGPTAAPPAPPPVTPPSPVTPPPLPDFTVADGYQIQLWAENPLLEKPTQMNWDAKGRLWVCSNSLYPQIEPGQLETDKILLLSDSKNSGHANQSTVFADGLLLPTGVAPDLSADGKDACYVGQSTELLHFADTGEGKPKEKRIVLSGFGTEDTHHILHTLKWGPNGRLYFDQSIYIHTHLETPWGMVRLNSGGIYSYDPRTERVEVEYKGWCNPWGHAWDANGQPFVTDGAGFQGISWAVPGAQYFTYENARRIMPSISPGNYPKFASLELIRSPHFPADWQGNAITCDFRAHRIVRFSIEDLATGPAPKSGYVTKEQADLVRTSDLSFRPIDVRLGPDGALYVADWSNPVINHGEVDFRDPRRDHHLGRIWRISKKDAPAVKWEPLLSKTDDDLRGRLQSPSSWEADQARRTLASRHELPSPVAGARTVTRDPATLAKLAQDPSARARVGAMRDAARLGGAQSAALVLEAALRAPADDPYYDYAAWLSINDLAKPWTEAIATGAWKSEGHEAQLAWGLKSIDPTLAKSTLSTLVVQKKVPMDGSGPWFEILGQAGGSAELQPLWDSLLVGYAGDCCETDETRALEGHVPILPEPVAIRALNALLDAARQRGVQPGSRAHLPDTLFHAKEPFRTGAVELAGLWKSPGTVEKLPELLGAPDLSPEARRAAFKTLRVLATPEARKLLVASCAPESPLPNRREAVLALAALDLGQARPFLPGVLASFTDESSALPYWRDLLATKGTADALAKGLPKDLPKSSAAAGVRAAREAGKNGANLLTALAPLAGLTDSEARIPKDMNALAEQTKQNGDPAKGELVYRRTASACVVCHAIGGAGGKVGPDLTSLGASAPLDYIIESVLQPALKVKEGYNAVTLTLKDGTQAVGIQSRETAQEIFLRTAAGTEQAVAKAQISSSANLGSLMPAGLTDALPDRDRLDLFAFLGQLGRPGPYDASKGTVARAWRFFPTAAAENIVAKGPTADLPGFAAYPLVDGRFTRDRLTEAADASAAGADTVLAVVQFQATGKTRLNLTGITKAWLDGKPLALGAEITPDLPSGTHTLAVKLGLKELPEVLRAESPDARFLAN